MSDPSFIARVLDFVVAVLGHWFVWVTGVPFVIEQGLPYFPERITAWVDAKWPRDRRHHILRWVCVLGLVVASFQAYDDVSTRLREAQSKPDQTKELREKIARLTANLWEPLEPEEIVSIRSQLGGMPPQTLNVLCSISNCTDLAQSIYDLIHGLNWKGAYQTQYIPGIEGIQLNHEIWSYNPNAAIARQIAQAIETGTKGRLKITEHQWGDPPTNSPPSATDQINLVLGRKN
jgi:hypothetical protein